MNIYKQTKTGNSQLLLVFSGWAASPEVFRQLETEPDTDLWICYDYRGMDFEGEALSGYRKIRLVAWSLGVWAASVMFGKKPVSFTEAIAVNGTPCPVHDRWGIPETIFRGTLDNVTEEGMRRFNRRMCGKRDIASLRADTASSARRHPGRIGVPVRRNKESLTSFRLV